MPQVLHLNALRGALKRHATRDELFKGDFATTILVHDPEQGSKISGRDVHRFQEIGQGVFGHGHLQFLSGDDIGFVCVDLHKDSFQGSQLSFFPFHLLHDGDLLVGLGAFNRPMAKHARDNIQDCEDTQEHVRDEEE